MRPQPGSATRWAAGMVSVSDTWMLSGTPSSSMRPNTLSSSAVGASVPFG